MTNGTSGLERRVIGLENMVTTLVSIVLNRQQLTKEQEGQIGMFLSSPMLNDMGEKETLSKSKRLFNRMTKAKSTVMNSVANVNKIDKQQGTIDKLRKQLRRKTRVNKFMTIGLPVIIVIALGFGFMVTQNLYKRYSGESLKSAYIAKHTKAK